MEDKLKKEIETIMASIFESKEEEARRQKTEKALQDSADKIEAIEVELASARETVESKDSEIAELTKSLEEAKAEKDTLQEQKEVEFTALEEAKKEVDEKLAETEKQLDSLHKDIRTDKRMEELESAGVIRQERDVQEAKIRDLDDEAFTAYKEELVSIKEQVLATLEERSQGTPDSDEEEEIVPANIDTNETANAALNLETATANSLADKYKALGLAMAEATKRK